MMAPNTAHLALEPWEFEDLVSYTFEMKQVLQGSIFKSEFITWMIFV
jgi:hypothetical protein